MDILLLVLYLVLLVLNLTDGITTWIFVRPDHYEREANPVARWMFKKLGITFGIILAELLWLGAVSLLYGFIFQKYVVAGLVFIGAGVLVWAYIIPGNIRYCLRLSERARKSKSAGRNSQEQDPA